MKRENYASYHVMHIPWSSKAQSPRPIFQRNPLSSPPPVATNVASVGLQATVYSSPVQEKGVNVHNSIDFSVA